jgi:hypothetical protein
LPVRLQDGKFRPPPARNEGIHARQVAAVRLPGWAGPADHSNCRQLLDMKVNRQPHSFSTLNHNLAYCYDASLRDPVGAQQAVRGFHRITGSLED